MSVKSHSSRVHSASSVLVETDSPALRRRTVELLIAPFTCKVYVVAPLRFMVSHNGAYDIIRLTPLT